MLKLQITVESHAQGDVEEALALVLGQIREGYTSGQDRNDRGRYSYTLSGEDSYDLLSRQGWEQDENERWQKDDQQGKALEEALALSRGQGAGGG